MKGLIFSELLEMVELKYGHDTMMQTIQKANLTNNGIYVSGGNYPFSELQSIVTVLSETSGTPASLLLQTYGEYLFMRLSEKYSGLFKTIADPITFLSKIDNYIHVEVHKLYPDAETPRFVTQLLEPRRIVLDYESSRKMQDFALGMMIGCAKYYKTELNISQEIIGESVRFDITIA